jgi:hypothetical protein
VMRGIVMGRGSSSWSHWEDHLGMARVGRVRGSTVGSLAIAAQAREVGSRLGFAPDLGSGIENRIVDPWWVIDEGRKRGPRLRIELEWSVRCSFFGGPRLRKGTLKNNERLQYIWIGSPVERTGRRSTRNI